MNLPTRLKRHRRIQFARLCLLFVVAICCSKASRASERGQTHYPVGVNSIMDAALPAPGETELYIYTQYYQSSRLNDAHGNSVDPGFRANVYAFVPRVVHTWKQTLGPFSLSSGAIVPLTSVNLQLFGRRDHSTGVGDPVVAPLYIDYVNATGTFFAYAGPEIYVPVGTYNKNKLANNGLHYWTIAPTVSMTWLPTPRWEVSATLYPEFNFKNQVTSYRSGNDVTLDWNVGWRPVASQPRLKIALQGFALTQYTDDSQNGQTVPGGNRGRAFGVGPQISWDIADGRGALLFKYQREFAVENRSQGNRFWFEFAVPI